MFTTLKMAKKLTKNKKNQFAPFVYGETDIRKMNLSDKIHNFFVERKKVTFKEKSLFYQLFSVLINAGVTTLTALKILTSRTENEKFYRILSTVYQRVEKGTSLSQAFSEFPEVFSTAELGVVSSGEAVGMLEGAFKRLSEQMEREASVRQELRSALTYPIIIGLVLVVATIVMVTFVIPEMRNLYIDNNLPIEGLTAVLLGGSDFVATNWLTILLGVMVVYTIFKIYLSSAQGKYYVDELLLRIPFVNSIVQKYNITQITRTLGILVESGLPIQKSLKLIEQAVAHSLYKDTLLELLGRVQTGEKLSQVLAESPSLYPPTVTYMLEIGENSANLGKLSLKVSEQYEEELKFQLKNVNTIIGPLVILFVAVFVIIFALAILLPIFNLTQSVAL